MRRKDFSHFTLLISFSMILITLLMLPHIDSPEPSPYFHIIKTPVIFWVGYAVTFILILRILFLKDFKIGSSGLVFFLIIILAIYIYNVPKLFYENSLYGDTYIFVSELFHIIAYGNIGGGHSDETPGLSLLSSQISIITGIEYITMAEILQYVIPLLIILFIYIIGKTITSKRTSLLSCLIFISINWMGFHFNRQSYSFMFQTFIYYLILKFMIFIPHIKNKWYIIIILSYSTLVILHPLSSLLIAIMNISLVILMYLYNFMRERTNILGPIENDEISQIQKYKIIKKALLLSVTCLALWFSWNILTQRNYDNLVRTIIWTIREVLNQPNPLEPAREFFSGYTNEYAPIVSLRTVQVVYQTITSIVIAFIAVLKVSDRRISIILLSWYVSCLVIAPSGLYTGHFFDRTFLHVLPVFSILYSWFITQKTPTDAKNKFIKITKGFLIGIMAIFFILLPLSMYSTTPFVFPPTTYLEEMDYIAKYGSGRIHISYADSIIGYTALVNNVSDLDIVPMDYSSITDIDVVVTNYRFYTKGAFDMRSPVFLETIIDIENGFSNNITFAKVYDSDAWHKMYVSQSNNEDR